MTYGYRTYSYIFDRDWNAIFFERHYLKSVNVIEKPYGYDRIGRDSGKGYPFCQGRFLWVEKVFLDN